MSPAGPGPLAGPALLVIAVLAVAGAIVSSRLLAGVRPAAG